MNDEKLERIYMANLKDVPPSALWLLLTIRDQGWTCVRFPADYTVFPADYTVLGVEADLVGVEEVAEDLHDEADQQQRAPGLVQPHRQPVARVLLGPSADGPLQQRVPSTDIVN